MQKSFLVEPAFKYKKSFLKAMAEVQSDSQSNSFDSTASATMFENKLNLHDLNDDSVFKSFLKKIKAKANLKKTFWLINKKESGEETFIGRVRIRQALDKDEKFILGHIGYLIRPSMRGLGYGNLILRLALKKAKKIVIDLNINQDQVLLACKATNLASKKIILNNGGVLSKEIDLGKSGRELLFWIKL